MEPPGGLPPDRDQQMVLHTTSQHQQQFVPLQKPNFTLNLPQQPLQTAQQSHAATSPAPPIVTITALTSLGGGSGSGNNAAAGVVTVTAVDTTNATTAAHTLPALASTATAISATTAAATAFSGSSVAHQHQAPHQSSYHQPYHQQSQPTSQQPPHNNSSISSSSLLGGITATSTASIGGTAQPQQTIEKLSRPLAFDKMESLVREMQDPEHGVPVRQQKMFLTSIPYAFMGYDLIEWLMDRLLIEESEALNIANQLCLHGYFFPVNDTKTLVVKDDSSLYRFQTPYYWPWQHKAPDNVEYAIYLAKRSLRNKQRHALEDYEAEALASLHKNLKGKWDFISMQAEEQVRLAKERKKGDKIVGDSQERAYWRVHRPPPGQFTPLEPCPVPSRDRQGIKTNKKKSIDDVHREVDYLKKSLNRTRMKMSQACESLVSYSETFTEYDAFLQPVLPSNPWVTEDITFWQLNNTFVDVPTEKRVKRWAINIEELVSDPTGLQEFTFFLEKEYSHENIRFWNAVNQLRRSAHSQVVRKVTEIFEEFLKPGAPCEINIDGKTMESVLKGLKSPSRFTFDSASEHIYMLLLKKDCYPRFVRSDHFKRLLETGIQPSHKKRFFGFGGVSGAKKKMVATLSSQANDGTSGGSSSKMVGGMMQAPPPGSLSRRRGSDRSLTGSAHELAVIGVNKDAPNKVPHSHSQSNLSEIPYSESVYRGDMPTRLLAMDAGVYGAYGTRDKRLQRATQDPPKPKLAAARLETTVESSCSAVCPWDLPDEPPTLPPPAPAKMAAKVQLSICPWEQEEESEESLPVVTAIKIGPQRHTSTSSDNSDVSDRLQRSLGIRHQNTVDSGEAAGIKRLIPNFSEQRRASVSFTPSRISEYQVPRTTLSKTTGTPSPISGSQIVADSTFAPLFTPFAHFSRSTITKDPPSTSSETELEEELNKLSLTENPAEMSKFSEQLPQPQVQKQQLPSTTTTKTTSTSPPITKITPPPESESCTAAPITIDSQTAVSPLTIVTEHEIGTEETVETVPLETSQIQQVQIELIETNVFVDPITTVKSPQRAKVNSNRVQATPIINIQECAIIAESELSAANSNSNSNSPTPKSPKIALEELQAAVDIADLESYLNTTKLSSDKSSAVSLELMAVSCEASPQRPTPSIIPPPLPTVGPMEEEMLLDDDDYVEEDEDIDDEDVKCGQAACQEELSPTTDEYQEGIQFGVDSKDVYDYDIVDTDTQTGYIAPAPTPAPTMAPLAVLDVDTVDDETMDEDEDVLLGEQIIRTPPKSPSRSPVGLPVAVAENIVSTVDNVATTAAAAAAAAGAVAAATAVPASSEEVKKRRKKRYSESKKLTSLEEKDKDKVAGAEAKADADRNTVCPWEDENVTTSDGTFVKTYATLGYL